MGNPAWYDTSTTPRPVAVNTKGLAEALEGLRSTIVHVEDAWIEADQRDKRLTGLNALANEDIAKRYGLED